MRSPLAALQLELAVSPDKSARPIPAACDLVSNNLGVETCKIARAYFEPRDRLLLKHSVLLVASLTATTITHSEVEISTFLGFIDLNELTCGEPSVPPVVADMN